MVAAIMMEMNHTVNGDTSDDHIRFAIKYTNNKYLEELLQLLPMSEGDEDISKVEAYRDKLRQQNLLDNEDNRDTPTKPFQDWDGNQSNVGAANEAILGG